MSIFVFFKQTISKYDSNSEFNLEKLNNSFLMITEHTGFLIFLFILKNKAN